MNISCHHMEEMREWVSIYLISFFFSKGCGRTGIDYSHLKTAWVFTKRTSSVPWVAEV